MARPDPPTRIYLDSSVLIAYLKKEPQHAEVHDLIPILLRNKYEAAVSSLHYVEVIGQRPGPGFDHLRETQAMALIEASSFKMVDIGPDVQLRARKYVLREGIKPADAMHLAAAVAGECDVLMTLDERLQKRFGKPRLIDGVWIDGVYLPWPEQATLPGI